MAYTVVISKDIRRQLERLPGHVKPLVKEALLSLPDNPRPPQSKQLEGHPTYYRIWISGDYRIVWSIFDEDALVELQYVGPKTPDLYAFLGLARPNNTDSN